MNVREIMTSGPITVSKLDSLDELMRTMETNQVRHLPVMDGDQLIGVLSDRDLLSATGGRPQVQRGDGGKETAGELIRGAPVCCSPDDSVVMIAVELSSRNIGCLPVLEGEKLVGIVTEMDLLDALIRLSGDVQSPKHLFDPVSELMTTELSSVAPHTTLGEAMELAAARGVRHLSVLEDHRLVGILSDRDLRKAVGRELDMSLPVSNLMTLDPLTIEPQEPLARAATCMLESKVSALPVTDDQRLIGILALSDLLDHCIVNLRHPDTYKRTVAE